jgi:hypothetical protein
LSGQQRTLRDCTGVGVSFPGLIDPQRVRITSTPAQKYDDAKEIDLVEWANQKLGLPLRLENDAHAALLGEWQFGAGAAAMIWSSSPWAPASAHRRLSAANSCAVVITRQACWAGISSSHPRAAPAPAGRAGVWRPRRAAGISIRSRARIHCSIPAPCRVNPPSIRHHLPIGRGA